MQIWVSLLFRAQQGEMKSSLDAKKLAQEQRRKELEEKRNLLKKLREENSTATIKKEEVKPVVEATPAPVPIKNDNKVKDEDVASIVDDLIGPKKTEPKEEKEPEQVMQVKKAPLAVQQKVAEFSVLPKTIPTYTKGIQVDLNEFDYDDDDFTSLSKPVSDVIIEQGNIILLEQNKENEGDNRRAKSEKSQLDDEVVIQELSEEEKTRILQSKDLARFLEDATRVAERALYISNKFDLLVDYSDKKGVEREGVREGEISLSTKLFSDRWSKNRCVTSIDWSPKFPELLVASYSENEVGTSDPDGVVLVWSSQNLLDRPEYVFNCQSQVLVARFAKFQPNIIVGGTYSGQVVLWDSRAKSTPVQRSPLSSVGHTHPVYCIDVVGTQNAHNLITISTDGTLCAWSLDNLLQPIEQLPLEANLLNQKLSSPVATTAFSFPEGDVNNFYIGTEEGAVFHCARHGGNQGVTERFQGHTAPVTGLDFRSTKGEIDFSDLFITSSLDWTCKLWSKKSQNYLYSFQDLGDCIYDCKWSPVHPALFASCDGTGHLNLWNLNSDVEVPYISQKVTHHSLNRVGWSCDGKKVACGDAEGVLHIYDVGELSNPSQEEWRKLSENIHNLANQTTSLSEIAEQEVVDDSENIII